MQKSKIVPLNINCKSSHIMTECHLGDSEKKFSESEIFYICEKTSENRNENKYKIVVNWGVL